MESKKSTLENMEIDSLFGGVYKNKKVLITGHNGFKGSWLTYWLNEMKADVTGISLENETEQNHFSLIKTSCKSITQDITDREGVTKVIQDANPEIIFHLAAQALVRDSYTNPYDTYMTNVMGTINVLDAARTLKNLKAIVIVTSDKCYDNKEWYWGYRENEAMGGKDPYSSSKGCTELVTSAYRNSFFNTKEYGKKHNVLIASVRAGNVIGGGDWAKDRIIPDMVKAVASKKTLKIRSPRSTRPWQHVLEPLSGYLSVGQELMEGNVKAAEGWNFGPENENNKYVIDIVEKSKLLWSKISYELDKESSLHEAQNLMLDSSKAKKELKWFPVWNYESTIEETIVWYKEYYENSIILTHNQLVKFINDANYKNIKWAKQ